MKTVRIVDGTYPSLAGRFSDSPIPFPSDVDYAWGAISKSDGSPALRYVFDPDPKFIRAGAGDIGPDAWRDSASGNKFSTNTGKSLVAGSAINGQPTIALDAATAVLRNAGLAEFNKDSFSFFGVINASGNGQSKYLIGPDEADTPAGGSCSITVRADGLLSIYIGSDNVMIEAGNMYSGAPVLVGVTFSTTRGVSIRRNGVQVAADPSRVLPIIGTALRLFSGGTTVNRFAGSVGKIVIADVDMSAPEYASGLHVIEEHLLELYGIASA